MKDKREKKIAQVCNETGMKKTKILYHMYQVSKFTIFFYFWKDILDEKFARKSLEFAMKNGNLFQFLSFFDTEICNIAMDFIKLQFKT